MTAEPLTPPMVEAKLRQLVGDLSRAQVTLAELRDREVDSKHALNRARRRALLSAECPKITRGGWSAAERDAWVADQVADLEEAFDRAVVARESAQDHLRTLRDQADCVRSLSASVRASYEMAGAAG